MTGVSPEPPGRLLYASLALIALFGVAYTCVSRWAFQSFPFSGDEYSIYLQAELFARGLLHAPAPPHADLLWVDHVVIDDLVRSKYPPGTAALLAVGVRAGVAWLVTPVEAVVGLGLLYWTSRRHFGDEAALVSLLVLGAAPLFAFQAGTFYAHTVTTMWLALAFAAVSLWTTSKRDAWPVLAGSALGWAFVTRPADAVFFGAALCALRSPRLVVLAAVGGAPFALANFAYQAAQFGGPFKDGYKAYDPTHRAIYGDSAAGPAISLHNLVSPEEVFHHIDVIRAFVVEWTVPGSVLVGLFGAYAIGASHPARAMRNLSVAIVTVFVGALLVMVADPDDGARPRYLSTLLIPLAFLAGAGWSAARDTLGALTTRRFATVVGGVAVALAVLQLGALCDARLPSQHQREGLYAAIEQNGVRDGVVVVRAQYPTRYARNGPFFDRPVLYLSAPAAMSLAKVQSTFPGRAIYQAVEGASWKVSRFEP